MIANIFIIYFALSFAFLSVIIFLIRKGKLKEQYSFLWLALSLLMMLTSMFPSILDRLAGLINVSYAPSLIFSMAILGILFILLHLTIAVSTLTERTIKLAQAAAFYEEKLNQLQGTRKQY